MTHVPGLRSCYEKIGRLVYVGRMFDKIRLHAAGRLPPDYQENLGRGFDGRACSFLGVQFASLQERVLAGGTDGDLLAWCHETGGARTAAECMVWNNFMQKRGWRDESSALLADRRRELGLDDKPVETFFDLIEFDEGRDPVATKAWLE